MDGEQRESDGPADRAWGIATWVIVVAATAVLIWLVLFLFDLGMPEEETVGLWWPA